MQILSQRRVLVHVAGILAVVLLEGCAGCGATAPKRPNLLLVTVDSLRADRLGYNGYPGAATPRIDALASRGTTFTRAFTPVPEATPAVASLLTGRYPAGHGLRTYFHAALGPTQRLPAEASSLAVRLKESGYETRGVASSLSLHPRFGLGAGFDSYSSTLNVVARPGQSAEIGMLASMAAEAGLQFLEASRGKPFFLWVNFYDPHAPYSPPQAFDEPFKDRPYDGEVAYLDQELGRLLDRLKEYAIEDQTVIVLAGTTGEGLEDHGEAHHGITLQQATVNVPLVIVAPDNSALPAGKKIDQPVSLVDVAPTILELLNLPPLPSSDGVSLLAQPASPRPIFIESYMPAGLFGWSRLVGVVERNWKYVSGVRGELYDLAADPGEARDQAGSQPETAKRLAALASAYDSRRPGAAALSEPARSRILDLGYSVEPAPRATVDPRDRVAIANDALRGDRSVKRRALQAAYLMLKGVLVEDPDNYVGLLDAALMSGSAGDLAGARLLLERARSLYPAASEVYHQLGHLTAAQQGAAGAERAAKLFDLAAELDPLNDEVVYETARLRAAKGDVAGALARIEQALAAGFRDYEWMAEDPDIGSLRGNPRFETLTEGKARRQVRTSPIPALN